MAGYSGTPLIKKLGIKAGMRLLFVDAPPSFSETLGPLPDDVKFVSETDTLVDFIIFFVDRAGILTDHFGSLSARLVPNGMLWIAWPKKAAKVPTDLTDVIVREIGLASGLVDVKVCAIDEKWSGIKFVIRLRDRPAST